MSRQPKLLIVLSVIVLHAACGTVRDPLWCESDADCTLVPGRTQCDLTGDHDADHIRKTCEIPWDQVDANPGDIDANMSPDAKLCTANTASCSNDVLEVCGPNGTVTSIQMCGLGCASTTRCYRVNPSNGLAAYMDLAVGKPDVVLLDGTMINTDTGVVTDAGGQTIQIQTADAPQTGGPAIRVLIAGSFKIHDVYVRGGRAVAFVAPGVIEIDGNLDASGDPGTAGPGSSSSVCSSSNGGVTPGNPNGHYETAYAGEPADATNHVWRTSGGGGAGGSTAGAAGGSDGSIETVGAAGGPYNVPLLVPLRGGCQGGANILAHRGGGGGGAQIVSDTSVVVIAGAGRTGVINVGGGGGRGATTFDMGSNLKDCAGGGGSGGGVLIEAPVVSLTGTGAGIIASGGAGGSGCNGADGKDAPLSGIPATGPSCPLTTLGGYGGTGGLGAAVSSAGVGGASKGGLAGGAGGGGLGWVRINTASGSYGTGSGTVVRGSASTGLVQKR